jgi:autotransporter-associated beta strand protein
LAQVTWTGAGSNSDSNWSNANNWAGGAKPTFSIGANMPNVANVIIPIGATVNYDSATVGNSGSAISNSGTINFIGSNNFTFTDVVSGPGSISQSGTGTLTIAGDNSFSGGINIADKRLILGSSNALGSGSVTSSGGTLGVSSGVTLPRLTINGAVTLTSNVNTNNDQNYNGALTILNPANHVTDPTLLRSLQGNILFDRTVTSGGSNQSLTVTALSGQVTFADQVGVAVHTYNAGYNTYTPTTYGSYLTQASKNLDYLQVNANSIVIKADITTRTEQEYNGSVLIGDNRDNTRNNGLIRVLLSEDPKITFNGTVNDLLENTHSLYLRAVTIDPSLIPKIELNHEVGGIAPLVKLDAYTGFQDDRDEANYSAIIDNPNVQRSDTITIRSNVTTFGDQIYSSNGFVLGNGQSNQLQTFTSFDGNIEFRSGSPSSGGGFVQDNSAGQSLFRAANGQVSGLSGSGLTYQIIDKNSSNLNNVSEIANPAANDAVNWAAILTNEFNRQLDTVEQFKEVTSEEGLVTIDDLILCDPKSDANECLR